LVAVVVLASTLCQALLISEQRAASATQENMARALSALVATRLAEGRPLLVGEVGNPFDLLQWQQRDYCGELAEGQAPRPGCWYFVPQHGWILYRSRFGGWGQEPQQALRGYALRLLAEGATPETRRTDRVVDFELQSIPANDLERLAGGRE